MLVSVPGLCGGVVAKSVLSRETPFLSLLSCLCRLYSRVCMVSLYLSHRDSISYRFAF